MVTLPINMRPTAVITLSGTVKDDKGMPLEATIRYEDLSTKKVLGELKTNPNDGTYFMILQPGKNYGYFASKDGYIHDSKNLDLRKLKTNKNTDLTQNFVLKQAKTVVASKQSIEISNLFFDTGKWEIRSESYPDLDRWIKILKNYPPSQEFVITGHTDNVKGKISNEELSKNRANEVLKYLIVNGIDKQRLSVKGYGDTKPRATNKTEQGKQLNRRVEIEFK
jgi:outer membrane protein OmpA-like peptidoglycan-associated protein